MGVGSRQEAPGGLPSPARPRSALTWSADAEPLARARREVGRPAVPGATPPPPPLRGEGTVSPTKQFPVVLHPLTHPSTRDVFKVLAHRRFTWRL